MISEYFSEHINYKAVCPGKDHWLCYLPVQLGNFILTSLIYALKPLGTIAMLTIKEETFSNKLNESQYHPKEAQTISLAFVYRLLS